MNDVVTHPVQIARYRVDKKDRVPAVVALRAYEAYSAIYRPQEALITGECRGGFGICELVAFLYARSFPKDQWCERFEEALRGMSI